MLRMVYQASPPLSSLTDLPCESFQTTAASAVPGSVPQVPTGGSTTGVTGEGVGVGVDVVVAVDVVPVVDVVVGVVLAPVAVGVVVVDAVPEVVVVVGVVLAPVAVGVVVGDVVVVDVVPVGEVVGVAVAVDAPAVPE